MSEKHRDCPFCRANDLKISPELARNGLFFVECQVCAAEGPPRKTELEAWTVWDKGVRYEVVQDRQGVRIMPKDLVMVQMSDKTFVCGRVMTVNERTGNLSVLMSKRNGACLSPNASDVVVVADPEAVKE